jgi:hypothetical protein
VPQSSALSDSEYRPFLGRYCEDEIYYSYYLPGTNTLTCMQGNPVDGFLNASQVLDDPHLYDGISLMLRPSQDPDSSSIIWGYRGSTMSYGASSIGEYRALLPEAEPLWGGTRDNPWAQLPENFGRSLAVAPYFDYAQFGDGELNSDGGEIALYCSSGHVAGPLRYLTETSGLPDWQQLPLGSQALNNNDYRYTVAGGQAQGETAVGVANSIAGGDLYLEWSDYGKWEALPPPPPDKNYGSDRFMSQAQLCVGRDGRWHLIYKDIRHDALYIRSTL